MIPDANSLLKLLLATWVSLAICSCTAPPATTTANEAKTITGEYFAFEPRRPGSLQLDSDKSFTIRLPTGLLDDGTPFLAEGKWRPAKNDAPAGTGLQTVAWLEVSRWGAETFDSGDDDSGDDDSGDGNSNDDNSHDDNSDNDNSDNIPLYQHEHGLVLMSPCMTWVFQKTQ